jgi:hypothetical protein
MFNRLNRNVAFVMCLGGVTLLAFGCADTDDATVPYDPPGGGAELAALGDFVWHRTHPVHVGWIRPSG